MISRIIIPAVFMFAVTISTAQTKRIEFTAPEMYPEGVVYDANAGLFYVSSVTTGTIGKVDASGNYSVVYADSLLKSTFGMKIAPAQRKLWVCVSDPNHSKYRDSSTYKKMARLIAIDLTTGTKVNDIDLASLYGGKHFANDLDIDADGNVYITDSYSPVIYKVDNSGKASVFAQSEWFASAGVGLNGIVVHPGGYLLVANNGAGALLKVDLRDPQRVGRVMIDQFFPGADGLLLDGRDLLLVQNKGVNKVFRLASADNWQRAAVVAATKMEDRFSYPSTLTKRNQEIWVMNAKLHELSDSTQAPSKKFSIQQAILQPVK